MPNEDPLKARVVYAVDGNSFECKFITTVDGWNALVDEIENPAVTWVHIDAKVDDIDANTLKEIRSIFNSWS